MRRRVLALIALATGCGNLTDAELGRCAEPTNEWWPLDEGNRWVYDVVDFHAEQLPSPKTLIVGSNPAPVLGLAGQERGVRFWVSGDEQTGWRWMVDDGSAIFFRRDVWLVDRPSEEPCRLGPNDDVRSCLEVTPLEEKLFLPGRTRLDYRADRLCERSRWSESYLEWAIPIADDTECPTEQWRSGPAACAAAQDEETGKFPEDTVDEWTVVSVSRRIEVPAGAFDDCLCVRRVREDKDATYCFARGVGKVFELDANNIAECLAEYCVGGEPCQPEGGPRYECDGHALSD